MKTIVVGMGNPILGDDRVGILIMRGVRSRFEQEGGTGDVTFIESTEGGLLLMDQINGFDRAILIDSVSSGSYPVGTLLKLTKEDFEETRHISNLHDINFATAMKMGNRMGHSLPDDIQIYAVEIKPALDFSKPMSPEVEAVIPKAVEEIGKRALGLK